MIHGPLDPVTLGTLAVQMAQGITFRHQALIGIAGGIPYQMPSAGDRVHKPVKHRCGGGRVGLAWAVVTGRTRYCWSLVLVIT